MKDFSTKAIHGDLINLDSYGSLRTPIYDSVAFEFESAKDIEDAFRGRKPAHSYSRITNPTVADFEKKITILSESIGAIAVASGMAAISNAIMALTKSGDSVITSKYLFGNTYSLFEKTLKRFGLIIKYVDFDNESQIIDAIDENTAIIFFESITNPQMAVYDFENIISIAKTNNVLTMIDNTVTTSYLLNTKQLGVDIEIVSTTKYISGGATSVGGLIIDNGLYDYKKNSVLSDIVGQFGKYSLLMRLRKEVFRNLGSALSPQNAYLQTLGLETLSLRIDKSCMNALEIARYLEQSDKVLSVNYPGIKSSKYYKNSRYFNNGFGGILTFELKDKQTCFNFINNLKIIRRSTNLNDNKSLVIHPSSTIYSEFKDDEKLKLGVSDNLIRLSVGIEGVADLIEDINESFSKSSK